MRELLAAALLAAPLCCAACVSAQRGGGQERPEAPAAEQALVAAELAQAASDASRALLADPSPAVRARAAIAAGRVADAGAAGALAPLLAEGGPAGEAAAWALGRVPGGEAALEACLKPPPAERACPDRAVAAAAARALGTAPREPPAVAALIGAIGAPGPVGGAAALALGVYARLGGKGADAAAGAATGRLAEAALAPGAAPALLRGAAYALGRVPKAPAPERPALTRALDRLLTAEPEVAALAARAWGRHGLPAGRLLELLRTPGADWRVQVEAARALPGCEGGPAAIAQALAEPSAPRGAAPLPAVRAHALAVLYESAQQAKLGLAHVPSPAALELASAAATAAVRCAAALARDRLAGKVAETPACAAGLEPEWRGRLRAAQLAGELAKGPGSPEGRLLLAALGDADGRVRGAAAGAAPAAFAAQLRALLADPDPNVAANAAGALAKDPAAARASLGAAIAAVARLSEGRTRGAGDPAADALGALADLLAAAGAGAPPEPPAIAAVRSLLPASSPALHRALADALGRLGQPAPGSPPPPAVGEALQAGLPGGGPRPRRLVLSTSAGELRLRLRSEDGAAPLSAAAVAALAGRGFYDGLAFHRVVPDFVVQGGDPRGDGEGGPGWAIPDEHTPLPFLRGTLGIATSGPDTGGSQLFVCHTAQPHLDGRYTVAGELESGAEALDSLQVGDTLLRAAVEY